MSMSDKIKIAELERLAEGASLSIDDVMRMRAQLPALLRLARAAKAYRTDGEECSKLIFLPCGHAVGWEDHFGLPNEKCDDCAFYEALDAFDFGNSDG
jgi:hypothetical protein